ncbi:MAG: SDR family NAD(P)-dependent oxidoreductase [Chloroflexi bacterium]|nr:SDR family NAD(P)-dependent oxidoreductase [Chloroflexota bacterium]MBM3172490.1 SDR family NAD(P)-dependent oxidoreductase [Chloroflexota bacterium]MBM3175106.1 SDR family NAD(P)-dependent oxidoreductase [Chloroflexota bacterium]MBM4450197.1 SDR family NAD(P)-dependent oxidoreductase [Chloroflexota bacterium]
MGNRLAGKVAIITGAGRGLGRAEALALAAEGAKIVVNDLGGGADGTGASQSPADEVVAEIKKLGSDAVANYDSVTTPEGGENIIKTAIDKFGRLDILVNNAGVLRDRIIFNMSEEEWDTVMKVHLYGTFHCTKPACIIFRQQRSGRIINTSSAAGLGNMGQANYSAAKEGIIGFTRTVARDMGKYGVTCNAIRPIAATRLTMSPELKAAWEKSGMQEVIKKMEAAVPEMVAPLVAYLCTDGAANINGYDFAVGGGQIGLYSQPTVIAQIEKAGIWTLNELLDTMPKKITKDLVNPAPPKP